MPYEERTIQRRGIVIDEISYYDDVLRPWIGASDPRDTRGKRKRKFIVRRDPRDISTVYFYDPDVQQYFAIPYRNTAHPSISVWELRQARRRLKEEGQKSVNEALIFDAYNRLRTLEAEAVKETQKTRCSAQRRRLQGQIAPFELSTPGCTPDVTFDNVDDIQPYEEIEELNG